METTPHETKDVTLYYIIGAIVLVVIAVAVFVMRPKANPTQTQTGSQEQTQGVSNRPSTPITALNCENMYYNPVIGFPKYYVTAEGVDTEKTGKVDCEFTISVGGKAVTTKSASSPLTDAPERGGGTFRCTTSELELAPGVATVIDVALTGAKKTTATCSQTFILPRP